MEIDWTDETNLQLRIHTEHLDAQLTAASGQRTVLICTQAPPLMLFDTLIRLSQCNWPSSRLLLYRSTAAWRLRSGAPSQAFHLVQDVKWLQRACEQGALCESDQRKGLTLRTFRDRRNSNEGEGAVPVRVCKILQIILFLQFQRRQCETSIVEE